MAKRRIIKRRSGTAAQKSERSLAIPTSSESFGLASDEACEVLIVGGRNYCSFTIARLTRLGTNRGIGITNSREHAEWAVEHLKPSIVIASMDHDRASGGIELMRKLQAVNSKFMVILTSSAIDTALEERQIRDLVWSMEDSWSFVTRRKTDNGDPLGIALSTARQGVGWIDFQVREQFESWRIASRTLRTEAPVAA